MGGKDRGKGKEGKEGKGKHNQSDKFEGYCGNCGKWGHKQKDCWSARDVNMVDGEQEEAEQKEEPGSTGTTQCITHGWGEGLEGREWMFALEADVRALDHGCDGWAYLLFAI